MPETRCSLLLHVLTALFAISATSGLSGCEVVYRSQMRQAAKDYSAGKIGAAEYKNRVADAQTKLGGYLQSMNAVSAAGFAVSSQMQPQQPQVVPVVVVPPARPQLLPMPSTPTYNVRQTGPGTYEVQRTGIPIIQ